MLKCDIDKGGTVKLKGSVKDILTEFYILVQFMQESNIKSELIIMACMAALKKEKED